MGAGLPPVSVCLGVEKCPLRGVSVLDLTLEPCPLYQRAKCYFCRELQNGCS